MSSLAIRAVAYIRVSTDAQAQNWSLDAQLREIEARAIADGYELVKVYSDDGVKCLHRRHCQTTGTVSAPVRNWMISESQ